MLSKRFICAALALLMLTAGAPALADLGSGQVLDYQMYLDMFFEDFDDGFYDAAIETYDTILELWPNAWDRTGGVDDYAIYARGFALLKEGNYSEANKQFKTFTKAGNTTFPEDKDCPNAGQMVIYCDGQIYMLYGMNEEAKEAFGQILGVLDATLIYWHLVNGDYPDVLLKVQASDTKSTKIALSWIDTDDDPTADHQYVINYSRKGVADSAESKLVIECAAELDNLIPETTYSISVTPMKNGSRSGLSKAIEVQTARASTNRYKYAVSEELVVYSYSCATRDKHNRDLRKTNRDMFFELFATPDQRTTMTGKLWSPIERGGEMILPIASMDFAKIGYLIHGVLTRGSAADPRDNEKTVRIVLRTSDGENDNLVYVKDVKIRFNETNDAGIAAYLDDLLEQVYQNQGAWPAEDCILDVYVDGLLLDRTSFQMVVE